MKIEAGKYYRTRDGEKVGPMCVRWPHDPDGDVWGIQGDMRLWNAFGEHWERKSDDLVSAIADPVDLTALITPFGLLDRETQEALKAHGGPYEIWGHGGWSDTAWPSFGETCVYRVKPLPPAPAKPRTIYLCEVHGTRTVFDTAIAATREALLYQHGEATVTEFVEVTK